MSKPTLSAVGRFSKKYPDFPEGGMRYLIFHEDTNGFKGCFPKIGRKRFIHEERFFARIIEDDCSQAEHRAWGIQRDESAGDPADEDDEQEDDS